MLQFLLGRTSNWKWGRTWSIFLEVTFAHCPPADLHRLVLFPIVLHNLICMSAYIAAMLAEIAGMNRQVWQWTMV